MPLFVEDTPNYFRSQEEILASLMEDMQILVPDLHTGEDGNYRMLAEVVAGILEGIYLANQIVSDDMFVTSANIVALQKHGDQLGEALDAGVKATGVIRFAGAGGTFIPIQSIVSYDPNTGADPFNFVTTADGTLPNPGIPTAPTATLNASAGNLTGLMEYVITFVTIEGETIQGAVSNAVSTASQRIDLSVIPLGGVGTLSRKIYRRKDGGGFKFVASIANNTTTTYADNIADGSLGGAPPVADTANGISIAAEAVEPGVESNAVPNSVVILTDVPDGITAATNPAAFTGGQNEQDWESFRQELLRKIRAPQTGSTLDLKNWAEEVDGVETATVFNNDNLGSAQNGHATIRISGPGGTVPPGSVVTATLAHLLEKSSANISLHVTTFTPVSTNVTVTITLASGYTLADVTPGVTKAISDYTYSLQAGETFRRNYVIDAVIGIPGVTDLVVNVPASDQTTAATEKRIPGLITVN